MKHGAPVHRCVVSCGNGAPDIDQRRNPGSVAARSRRLQRRIDRSLPRRSVDPSSPGSMRVRRSLQLRIETARTALSRRAGAAPHSSSTADEGVQRDHSPVRRCSDWPRGPDSV